MKLKTVRMKRKCVPQSKFDRKTVLKLFNIFIEMYTIRVILFESFIWTIFLEVKTISFKYITTVCQLCWVFCWNAGFRICLYAYSYLISAASCNTTHNCSPYADCLYNPMTSSYECKCLSEFIGDGYNCVDARQIQQSTHNKPDTTVPSCLIGKCWCPTDYILHNNLCVRSNFAGQGESDGMS